MASKKKSVRMSSDTDSRIEKDENNTSLPLNKSLTKDIEAFSKKDWRSNLSQITKEADEI